MLRERFSEFLAVSLSFLAGLGTAYSIVISYYGVFIWALPLFIILFDVPAIYLVRPRFRYLSSGQKASVIVFFYTVVFMTPAVGIYGKMEYLACVFFIDFVMVLFLIATFFAMMIMERRDKKYSAGK